MGARGDICAAMVALAHRHYHPGLPGGGHILSEAEIANTLKGLADYGVQVKGKSG